MSTKITLLCKDMNEKESKDMIMKYLTMNGVKVEVTKTEEVKDIKEYKKFTLEMLKKIVEFPF